MTSVAAAGLFLAMVAAQPLVDIQYQALMNVYASAGCNDTVCPRFAKTSNCSGTRIHCFNGTVVNLGLTQVSLNGSIASSIALLSTLTYLSMAENSLTGAIPSFIGRLTALQFLVLSSNNLSGTIPSEIGGMQTIETLIFENNKLTGPIPSTIGRLTTLIYLGLQRNRLNGTIPSTIIRLTLLEKMFLNENSISGHVPPLPPSLKADSCYLQSQTDSASCLDCSAAQSNCACESNSCSMSTLSIATTTTTTAATTATTTTTTTTTESTTSHLSTATSTQATDQSVAIVQSLSTTSPTETIRSILELESSSSTLSVVAETNIPPTGDLYVLIGSIIGGILALMLVLAVIAFCVIRSRRRPSPAQPIGNHDETAVSTVDIFRHAGESSEYASFNYDEDSGGIAQMVVYADAPAAHKYTY